jgi:arylformamidase
MSLHPTNTPARHVIVVSMFSLLFLATIPPGIAADPGHAVNGPYAEGQTRDTIERATPFTPPPEDLTGLRTARDVAYVDGPARDPEGFHTLDITAPAKGKDLPVLIFIHGGGWTRSPGKPANSGRGGPYNAGFARAGVVFVSISYRLSPDVQHPVLVEDCARAFAWVRQHIADYGGSPDKIFLTGHSAGAHLAALLATNPEYLATVGETLAAIRGCIPISGNYWVDAGTKGGRIFGTDPAILRRASPAMQVSAKASPFLIFCGDHYPWEPKLVAPSAKFAERLRAVGVAAEFHQIADRDHETILTRLCSPRDETTDLIYSFISHHSSP